MTQEPRKLPRAEHLQWFGLTDKGRIRKNNEDSFLGVQLDAQEVRYLGKSGEGSVATADYVFAVSDGMGGAMAGEFASQMTVQTITRLIPQAFKQAAAGLEAGFEDVLTELFSEIHRALMLLGNSYEECAGMGATLSLSWFTPGWMYFAHVGDSRIYYLPAGNHREIKQLTNDDTYVGWLFRNGKLNEREARYHPQRNMLQKALGAGHQYVDPQIGAVACEPGDMFLLCSDGLVEGLYDSNLLQLLRSPEPGETELTPAERLVDASLERAGHDNTTALVIEISQAVK